MAYDKHTYAKGDVLEASDLNHGETGIDTNDENITSLQGAVGTLTNLTTDAKTSLVAAINEVDSHANSANNNAGTLSNLTTDAKNNLVAAINEVDGHADSAATAIGDMTDLETTATDLVGAANELKDKLDTLPDPAQGDGTYVIIQTNGNMSLSDLDGSLAESAVIQDKADVIVSSASGSIASFSDGADGLPVVDLKCDIEPVQDLHGYSNPWPAGGGKNLLPMTVDGIKACNTNGTWSGNVYTSSGITFTLLTDDGSNITGITVNGIPSVGIDLMLSNSSDKFFQLNSGTQYIVTSGVTGDVPGGAYNIRIGNSTDTYVTATTDGTATFTADTSNAARIHINAAVSNLTFKPMIRLASDTDATFQPYTNICPINGFTGTNVERCGKNLCPNQITSESLFGITCTKNSDGSLTLTGSGDGTANPFFYLEGYLGQYPYLLKAGTYVLSQGITLSTDNMLRVASETAILAQCQGVSSATFTVNKDVYVQIYLRLDRSSTWTTPTTIYPMIRLASDTDATYEPYQGQTVNVTFPTEAGTVYGGTLDVTSGVLVVDRASVDLGTLEWKGAAGDRFLAQNQISNWLIDSDYSTPRNAICSMYPWKAGDVLYNESNPGFSYYIEEGQQKLFVKNLAYSDAATFKTAMSGVLLVYEVATPTTVQLTPNEVRTLLGTNNIWADTGDSTVQYRADSKLYIDGKIDSVHQDLSLIAPIENGTTASQAYAQGQYFLKDNQFCKAKTAIASGATFTLNTNYEVTTVAAELFAALS